MTDQDETTLSAQRPLEPKSEGELIFRGKSIKTATMPNGQGFVVLRSLCDAFDLNYSGQRQRAQRTALFQQHSALLYIHTPGGRQAQPCLSAFAVPAFLMGVESSRVASDEARELLDVFQEEGMIVLAEYFGLSERGEIRFLRESIARLSVEQDAFEGQMVKNIEAELAADRRSREEQVQKIRDAFAKMRDQIHVLEKVVGPKQRITPEQLGQIREVVMVLGELMIRAGASKRPWPSIYTDLTLQFGFASSQDITQEAFPRVMEFLNRQVQAFREALLSGKFADNSASDEKEA